MSKQRNLIGFAHEQIPLVNKVQSLDPKIYQDAEVAYITISGNMARWTYTEGVEPSNILGHLIYHGGEIRLEGQGKIKNFKACAIGMATTLDVTYERE